MVRDDRLNRALDWLQIGFGGVPVAPLRWVAPGRSEYHDRLIANLRSITSRLRDQPDYWEELIRSRNWRLTTIGVAAVALSRDRRFGAALRDRFAQPSFVTPQIAVAFWLVYPTEARVAFEALVQHHLDQVPADLTAIFTIPRYPTDLNLAALFAAATALGAAHAPLAAKFAASPWTLELAAVTQPQTAKAHEALAAIGTVQRLLVAWSHPEFCESGQ